MTLNLEHNSILRINCWVTISLGPIEGKGKFPPPHGLSTSICTNPKIFKMSFKKKTYMRQVQNGQNTLSSSSNSEDNYQCPRSLVFRDNKWVRPSTTSTSSSDEG